MLRALGDIGNVGGVTTRSQAAKDKVRRLDRRARAPTGPRSRRLRLTRSHSTAWSWRTTLQGPPAGRPSAQPLPTAFAPARQLVRAAAASRAWAPSPPATRPRPTHNAPCLPLSPLGTQVVTKPTALKPRDEAAAPAAGARPRAPPAAAKGGSSLSSLLQTRSELASAKRAPPAAPASPLPDIDSQDRDNPLAAAEYAQDIYCYYRRVEPRFAVAPEYMTSQVGRGGGEGAAGGVGVTGGRTTP